jgi:hypothetical protein
VTLVFVLLLFGTSGVPQEVALFNSRESCAAYAGLTYGRSGNWRCVPVPTRKTEDVDELE